MQWFVAYSIITLFPRFYLVHPGTANTIPHSFVGDPANSADAAEVVGANGTVICGATDCDYSMVTSYDDSSWDTSTTGSPYWPTGEWMTTDDAWVWNTDTTSSTDGDWETTDDSWCDDATFDSYTETAIVVLDCVDTGLPSDSGQMVYADWSCEDGSLMMGYYLSDAANATNGCQDDNLVHEDEFEFDGYCPDCMMSFPFVYRLCGYFSYFVHIESTL